MAKKTITVQTYGDYPKYATPDDKMMVRMLHLTLDKNKLHGKKSAQSVKECMTEYEIHSKSVYDILDQIFKNTDAWVQEEWKMGILCHPLQVARPKQCESDSYSRKSNKTWVPISWSRIKMLKSYDRYLQVSPITLSSMWT